MLCTIKLVLNSDYFENAVKSVEWTHYDLEKHAFEETSDARSY